ncbi:MAG: hypothetical protein KDK39_12685 [Leptospiraceae bacterium]|nr:hypothetical protein [Leptospiraceae bacterium]
MPPLDIPYCGYGPEGAELTFFGDSRAWNLATGLGLPAAGVEPRPAIGLDTNPRSDAYGQDIGTVSAARDVATGNLIIAPGQITHHYSHNLGWPGATATDIESLNAPVHLLLGLAIWSIIGAFSSLGLFGIVLAAVAGFFVLADLQKHFQNLVEVVTNSPPDGKNWNRRLAHCILNEGLPYRTANHVVISIGGNDMLDFYNYMEGFEGLYFFFRVITNPKEYLESLLYGRGFISKWSKEAFWLWQFEVKEDAIVQDTKSLIQYHLDNLVIPPYTKPNEVLLISVAPTIARKGSGTWIWQDLEGWVRLTFYLRRLRDKYQWEIVPHFTNERYAGRFHFLDTYDRFLHNIIWEHAGYYFPSDGIHFTAAGNEQLGRMIAAKAVQIGWFAPNANISQEAVQDMANGLVVNASDYCSASHPARCATQTNCEAFGNHWCNNICQTTGCAVPVEGGGSEPPPGPDWGAIGLCFFLGWCG